MHERKMGMFERSDAFITCSPVASEPWTKCLKSLTWKQLLLHHKPIVIFNYEHYWDPLIAPL